MGSTGSGMFGAYPSGGGGALGSSRDASGDNCPLKIENIRLEDVAISEYYLNNEDVPSVGEEVELSVQLVGKRLVVVLTETQEVIGNMPVTYNNLKICMTKGMSYAGEIKSSGLSPVPYIVVNLYAR